MKRITIFAVLTLLLGGISASYAQSVDPALVTAVTEAFDRTNASTSLHIVTQSLIAGDNGGQQQRQAEWSLAQAADGSAWNLSGSTTTIMQMGDTQMQNLIQYIVLDGVTYVNLDGSQLGQVAQPGWFEVTGDQSGMPMLGATDSLASQALGGLQFPVNAESVTAISALPDDTIDGQAVSVYQISLDPQVVIDSAASALLVTGGGQPAMNGTPSADFTPPAPGDRQIQPPTDRQIQPPQDGGRPALDPANVRVTIAVYIGQTDGFVHRIYSVVEMANSMAITTVTDFSAFNQPVEIAAPEVSS